MLDPPQLRCQDRADRPRVDRAVRVPARARVDRADVEARAAADAVQSLPAHLVGEHARAAVVEQHDVQLLRPVAVGDAGPERRVRVHALAGRGARQQLQEHLEVGEARQQLLDPEHRHEHRGQRRAHAAVALGLDDADRSRLRDPEVRARDADARAEEPLAQIAARRLGEVGGLVRSDAGCDRAREQVADLRSVAVDRGHEDVRRPVAVELQDQLGEVGLERVDPRVRQRGVQLDLVRRERLHLHDLVCAVRARDVGDDGVRLLRVARPVHHAAGRLHRRLELHEVLVEVREHVLLDRAACFAQRLPVGHLCDDAGALGADRVRRLAQVRAQLRVLQLGARRLREARHADARISARCTARAGAPRRERPPPIWSRHEPSTAVQTAARVSAIASHLSASIALDVSAFLIANVPPKPQHSSRSRKLDQLEAAHVLQQPQRRVADAGHAQRMARRVVRDAPCERRADVFDAEPAYEQLGELEDVLHPVQLAHGADARRRR